MKNTKNSRTGCLFLILVFLLITVISSVYFRNSWYQKVDSDMISWAEAAEKCKEKFKAKRPAGVVKVSNCKKRTEDEDFFYFSWKKPLAIFIGNSKGGQDAYSGTCQVSRKSGEIVHLTLNRKVLVNQVKK